ncbi:hypothetical protein Ahy_B08g093751 isoform B [Arachis hypogaea]|uniref:Uncharacterized protein n=1 Tax=Arachis hypogaea TaxID=3818 RepID=A0A444Y6T0_ARAHY|nr:hypothetical protein Ahy_B08g093751 isoform A [Arachis hypogaea]RYQ97671.1 hypothetical protein Ahy_B08g093751 isoform B [Arachis hypogaea]
MTTFSNRISNLPKIAYAKFEGSTFGAFGGNSSGRGGSYHPGRRSSSGGVESPTAKPPYLFTNAAIGRATASGTGEAAVLHRGSGAVAKEEEEDTVHDGGSWIQSGEDGVTSGSTGVLRGGVVATRGAPNGHVEAALSSDSDPCRGWFCRASYIVAKPPLLTAAVFPWERHDETRIEQWDTIVVEGAHGAIDGAFDGGNRGNWRAP